MANSKEIQIINENDFEYEDWMKYKRIIRMIDNMDTFAIASQICELGIPSFTNEIPTASVGLDREGNIQYLFNKKFYRELSDNDTASIFLHEVLHVAFEHIKRSIRIGINDPYRAKLWNFAVDCIVNTWVELLGFPFSPELREKIILPEKIKFPNFNSGTSSEDIYRFLLDQNKEDIEKLDQFMQLDSHEGWGQMDNPQMDSFSEKVAENLKDEFFKMGEKNADKKAAEELKKKSVSKNPSNNTFREHAKSYGKTSNGELRHYQNLKGRIQTDILRKIHKRIKSAHDPFPKVSWMRSPRKLASVYPGVIMPGEHELENNCRYSAVLAIDSSGSITDDMISQDVRIGRSFPLDKIDYVPIAFDTRYYELDKKEFYNKNKYPKIPGRGGTDLSCVEAYIQEVYMKKYRRRPDIILVMTDAFGSHPIAIDKKNQKDYVWILTKNHSEDTIKNYCPGGMIFKTNIS